MTVREDRNLNSFLRIDHIITISAAWDYAAKIFFKLQEFCIKNNFPDSYDLDNELTDKFYKDIHFRTFIPHTHEEIMRFYERHINDNSIIERIRQNELKNVNRDRKLVEQKKKRKEIYNPNYTKSVKQRNRRKVNNSMHISKLSIAYLYASILFTALSNLAQRSVLPPLPPHPKLPSHLERLIHLHTESQERAYAVSISQFFDLLRYIIDTRNHADPLDWSKIFDEIRDYGYGKASRYTMRSRKLYLCKNCSDFAADPPRLVSLYLNSARVADINSKKSDKLALKCYLCGKNESIEISVQDPARKLSIRNIKNREHKVKLDFLYFQACYRYFQEYMKVFLLGRLIPEFNEVIKEESCAQEIEAKKSTFLKDGHWYILHYDKTERKNRSHYLSKASLTQIERRNIEIRNVPP